MKSGSSQRFSERVEAYVAHRPRYPREVLAVLQREIGLASDWIIADIGSGTGFSAELFLRNGNMVYGIEPNEPMRRAGEALLRRWPRFVSIEGTAEATTLPSCSVDLVVAAQAFHWFDARRAGPELARILKPPRRAVLLWNTRRSESTPFLRAYEELLLRFGTDYTQVRHDAIGRDALRSFYGGDYGSARLYNEQIFDWEGLKGRLSSSSYAPPPGHPSHQRMLEQLDAIFSAHQEHGLVRFEYDTEVYYGTVEPAESA